MVRAILVNGTVAGLIAGTLLFGMTILIQGSPLEVYGVVIGYLSMLIALSTIFVAIKRQRDRRQGGVIRFRQGVILGLGISVIASIFYALAWELTIAVMPFDFPTVWIESMIAEQRARGISGPELARFIAQMEQFRRDYANPLYRLAISFSEIFPVGALVTLVSAGLLRNRAFLPARPAMTA